MAIYIVRRLIAAGFLLLVVTAPPGVIFFVLPRLGGATIDDLASRYVGKSGSVQDIHAIAVKLGLTDPVWVQYGRFLAALFVGADYSTGPTTVHCPAPCLGYSFINQNPVLPDLLDRLPVTLSLAAGAAGLWLGGGGGGGGLSGLGPGSGVGRAAVGGGRRGAVAGGRGERRSALGAAPRQRVRPRGDGRRARGRLVADLLHRPAVAGDLQLLARHHRAGWQLHAVRAEPAAVGVRPAPA